MGTTNYLRRIRSSLLPGVKDWSDSQDHLRHAMDVRKLSYSEWFWCHTSAYKLVYYGLPVLGMLNAWVALLISIKFNSGIGKIISDVLGLASIYLFFVRIIRRRKVRDLTFYDIYLRDLPLGGCTDGQARRRCI